MKVKQSILCDSVMFSGLGKDFVCKRFAVPTLLWSLEFVIQINLEHDTNENPFSQNYLVSSFKFYISSKK